MATNPVARYYKVFLTVFLILSSLLIFHAKETKAATSCSASVTPSSVQPNTQDIVFNYSITNTGSSTILWIKITRPTSAIIWKSFLLSGWNKSVSGGEFLLTKGAPAEENPLTPGKTVVPKATVDIGDAGGFSGNWVIKVSDDIGGANPSSCSGSLGLTISGGAPDTIPPVISGISVTDITASSVKVNWTTNEKATSKVEYGLESEVYSLSKSSSVLTESHSLTLTAGIGARTTYYYRVCSTDGAGNEKCSSEKSFTTTSYYPPPTPTPTPTPTPLTPAPTVTITTKLTKVYKTPPKVQGKVTDQVAVAKIEYSLDNGRNWLPVDTAENLGKKEATFTFTPKRLPDGNYLIKARATNPSGNVGTSKTATLVIDLLPPRLGGNSFFLGPQKLFPTEDGFLSVSSGSQISMIVSAVGGPTTVKMKVNTDVFGLQPVAGTTLWRGELTFTEEGLFDLEATSTDGAGNVVTQKLTPISVSGKGRVSDPSGNPVEGAEVTLYLANSLTSEVGSDYTSEMSPWRGRGIGGTVRWEAEIYGQENPQKTDEGGSFHYLLPAGSYQLKVESKGYREFISGPFTVEESTPLGPTVVLEPRPGITLFGRRLALPWFLDLFARRKEIALELPTLSEVEGTEMGVGERAPDFTLPSTLGGTTNLRALRRRKVLITFWTTWDPLSVEQITVLDKLIAPRGVVLLPVALQESPGRVATFLGRGNYLLPSLVDKTGAFSKNYRILSIPQHFLINKDGRIEEVRTGVLSAQQIMELLK